MFESPALGQRFTQSHELQQAGMAVGDLNADRLPDVVGGGLSDFMVLLGAGDGSFRSGIDASSAGSSPFWFAIADFDLDGHADVGWGGYDTKGVSFGDGTATSWDRTSYASNFTWGVAAGDFDGDARPDLAVHTIDSGSFLEVLLSRPGRTFDLVSEQQDSLELVDPVLRAVHVDGDSHLDLLALDRVTLTVRVLLGDGDGTFTPRTISQISAPGDPTNFVPGDFNGDSLLDIVVAHRWSIVLIPGHGDGTFGAHQTIAVGPKDLYGIALGDVSGDGLPDIVAADRRDRTLVILEAQGGGTFGPLVDSATVGYTAHPLILTDINADERLDVLGPVLEDEILMSALGGEAGELGRSTRDVSLSSMGFRVAAADLNQDGLDDLVAVTGNPPTTLEVVLSGPGRSASLIPPVPFTFSDLPASWVTRVDADGLPDIGYILGDSLKTLRGNGDGTFAPLANSAMPSPLWLEEATGDEHVDVVAVVGSDVNVYPGLGDGFFGTPMTITLSVGPGDLAVGDVNGDSLPDIALKRDAVAPWNPPSLVRFAIRDSGGGFALDPETAVGGTAYSLVVTDSDLDGSNDLVALVGVPCSGCPSGIGLEVASAERVPSGMLGPWATSARPPGIGPLWGEPVPEPPGIFGHLDAGFYEGQPAGDGTFGLLGYVGGYPAAREKAVGDFDGDGKRDVAVVWRDGTTRLSIFYGRDGILPQATSLAPSGAVFGVGQEVSISWSGIDNAGLVNSDLFVSLEGANGPFEVLALNLPAVGQYLWTATGEPSDSVFFKVVLRDSAGNASAGYSGPNTLSTTVAVDSRTAPSAALGILGIVPNPVRHRAAIHIAGPAGGHAKLTLHDLQGRIVTRLFDGRLSEAGTQVDVSLDRLGDLRQGIYFVTLSGGSGRVTRRLVVMGK